VIGKWCLFAMAGASFLTACSGGEPEPAATAPGQETAPAAGLQQTQVDSEVVAQSRGETELMREVFSYRGATRDPFVSLIESGDVRPLVQDLRITSITYDPRYPAASVAVLRDTILNQAYALRVGDEVGRIRVAEITPGQVVIIVSEFGSERQVVLRQRRRQEGTQ
jgi:hypothetical protein